jgi:hypothetical protein
MTNFSFFHTRGGSGYIRGYQMAKYLNGLPGHTAKDKPLEGYENDLCIYSKVVPPEKHPKWVYCDVDDSPKQLEFLKTHPEFGVIAISLYAKEQMSKILKRDDIIFIPHQHCNFERRIRPPREVKTVGIIGQKSSFQYPTDKFRKMVESIGMELKYEEDYWNVYKGHKGRPEMRLNVADFYYSLDVQVVWRPTVKWSLLAPFANPNKLGNSSSFGIPTVSFPEKNYLMEFDGCFLPANTIDEMIMWLEKLKTDIFLYDDLARKNLARSEFYHIDNVAKMYLELK